ncbi:hypothetical protein QZH41_001418 [Actinostola sp. cb2023]|nr:hypothetical protein QZH41_001418 [Actinostola sp. cb2023]
MSKLSTECNVSSTDTFSPLTTRLKTLWENTTETDRKSFREKALQGCRVVCDVVAPNAGEELLESLYQPKQTQSENVSEELTALMTAYRDAPSKNVKMQILNIYAFRFSAEKLMKYHEPYEKLTRWQIKQARRHAKTQGPGVPEEKTFHHRVRLPMSKVDHFIDFINRPYFYQDVAYGTRVLKLDSGEKVTMPNVVRTVTRSTMIYQYLQYCSEDNFLPLCRRTLFKILEVREASQRKSLQGLDNIATDGSAGFETLGKIVDELGACGAKLTWCNETTKVLKGCKCYLKTEYPVHCANDQSTCPDHCRDFALSDENDKDFRNECSHSHDVACDKCESLKGVLQDIEHHIQSSSVAFYSSEQQQDLLYDLKRARANIYEWKAHILRSCNQEKAKQDILRDMDPTEAIIVMDWAMKFQQMRYREKQSQWYGKRGLSWHVSCVVFKDEKSKEIEVQSYVHLFDSCNQDWYAVASVVEDLLMKINQSRPSISVVYLRSDEAGCYHNNFLVAALKDVGQRAGITVKRLDHSEPQHGKDICDRILCPIKAAIRRFCNEGHDILNAGDMQSALVKQPVRGTSSAVCSINESRRTAEVKKIEGFSKFHNFCFEHDGVRIWRCYSIGTGKVIPYKSLIVKSQGPTQLVTKEHFFAIRQSRALKPTNNKSPSESDESQLIFACTEPGCNQAFARFADFELHLDVGEHVCLQETEEKNVYDNIRRDWANRCTTVNVENTKSQLCSSNSTTNAKDQQQLTDSPAAMGWALHKTRGGAVQFSQNIRDYLTTKFDLGEKTGLKADAEQVAKDMRNARTVDNQRIFTREEWLTKSQIQGFFSRLVSARRKRITTIISNEEEIDEDIQEQEQLAEVSEVIEKVGLTHPIVYDVYNICQYYHSNKISSFNVNMLRDMCRHFQITFKFRDLKKDLVSKVADLVKECSCSKS